MAQNDIDLTPLNSQLASMSLEDCEYSNTLMERIFKQIDHENQCTDPTTVKMLCNMFNITGKIDQYYESLARQDQNCFFKLMIEYKKEFKLNDIQSLIDFLDLNAPKYKVARQIAADIRTRQKEILKEIRTAKMKRFDLKGKKVLLIYHPGQISESGNENMFHELREHLKHNGLSVEEINLATKTPADVADILSIRDNRKGDDDKPADMLLLYDDYVLNVCDESIPCEPETDSKYWTFKRLYRAMYREFVITNREASKRFMFATFSTDERLDCPFNWMLKKIGTRYYKPLPLREDSDFNQRGFFVLLEKHYNVSPIRAEA